MHPDRNVITKATEVSAKIRAAASAHIRKTLGFEPRDGACNPMKEMQINLKFDYRPLMVAAAAYVDHCYAATIRYELEDVQAFNRGVHFGILTSGGDRVGTGRPVETVTGSVEEVFGHIRKSRDVRYGSKSTEETVESLGGYYDDEITKQTEVTGLVYTPRFEWMYTDHPPAGGL